jgi:small subunit ribosomal protein S5
MSVAIRLEQLNLEEQEQLKQEVIMVRRVSKTVTGGKRLRFNALVVVGNENGIVGWGYGKAKEVPFAMEKAARKAKQGLIKIPLKGTTIPHEMRKKVCATIVYIKPAGPGTGVKAGAVIKPLFELAGIKDILSKVYRSSNPLTTIRAAFECLKALRSKEEIEQMRGVKITREV